MWETVNPYIYIRNDLQLGNLRENCLLLKLYRKLRKRFLNPRLESNPQPSDLRRDALTIELPGLRWQREGYDVYWFVRATYVLHKQQSRYLYHTDSVYLINRYIRNDPYTIFIFDIFFIYNNSSRPTTYAWEGGKLIANKDDFLSDMVVTKAEYEEQGKNACRRKFGGKEK